MSIQVFSRPRKQTGRNTVEKKPISPHSEEGGNIMNDPAPVNITPAESISSAAAGVMEKDVSENRPRILAAISASPTSAVVIRFAGELSLKLNLPWAVVYVDQGRKMTEAAQQNLLANLRMSRSMGAQVLSTADPDPVAGIIRVATQLRAAQLVVGKTRRFPLSMLFSRGSVTGRLLNADTQLAIQVVPCNIPPGKMEVPRVQLGFLAQYLKAFAIALVAVAAITGVNLLLVPLTGYWTIALVYLMFVTVYALFNVRMTTVVFVSFASALLWNFLFIPPLFTFNIGLLEDALMNLVFFVIAVIVGLLGTQLRHKERVLRNREKRITMLYELTKAIDAARSMEELCCVIKDTTGQFMEARVELYLTGELKKYNVENTPRGRIRMTAKEYSVIYWVLRNRETAGRFSVHFSENDLCYLPIIAQSGILGVMLLDPVDKREYTIEQELFLQNVLNQIAIALEREALAQRDRDNVLVAESERLYKILFDSVSHELRTPLTTINGASSSLLDPAVGTNEKVRTGLVTEIKRAGDRLNRVIGNMLGMSRMQSGRLKLSRQWHEVGDILDAVLSKDADALQGINVSRELPEGFPLIYVDFNLFEQVLANIMGNVARHAGVNATLHITGMADVEKCLLSFRDSGPGIPEDELTSIFDKPHDTRGRKSRGLGLGLTICKRIMEAHGGSIGASNAPEGGAIFTVCIPVVNGAARKEG
ncbi:MAG: DUF4118 domain-containing protein [Spirochaetaceae bacterium]|nr:MAG: DUF4118 domain-containing protein [Spirochaetaceae bacterium]